MSRLRELIRKEPDRKPHIRKMDGLWWVRRFDYGADILGRGRTIFEAWEKAKWALQH